MSRQSNSFRSHFKAITVMTKQQNTERLAKKNNTVNGSENLRRDRKKAKQFASDYLHTVPLQRCC